MSRLSLMPVGDVERGALEAIAGRCEQEFGWEIRIEPPIALPEPAFDAKRGQYEAIHILRTVIEHVRPHTSRTLGVVSRDLFIPMLTFVFGQAQLKGSVAIMSLARLRQEYYGLPSNGALMLKRAEKEAMHELGHTFGLIHCTNRECAMALSNNIQQVDVKAAEYCRSCTILLQDQLRTIETESRREQA